MARLDAARCAARRSPRRNHPAVFRHPSASAAGLVRRHSRARGRVSRGDRSQVARRRCPAVCWSRVWHARRNRGRWAAAGAGAGHRGGPRLPAGRSRCWATDFAAKPGRHRGSRRSVVATHGLGKGASVVFLLAYVASRCSPVCSAPCFSLSQPWSPLPFAAAPSLHALPPRPLGTLHPGLHLSRRRHHPRDLVRR